MLSATTTTMAMADNAKIAAEINENAQRVTFQLPLTRRRILLSYWVVVILAIPLWHWTTSIQRLALPSARVHSIASQKLAFSLNVGLLAAEVPSMNTVNFAEQVESELKGILYNDGLKNVYKPTVSFSGTPETKYIISLENKAGRTIKGRQLEFGVAEMSPSEAPKRLAQVLASLLATRTNDLGGEQHVMPFSSRYRLAFTLLNEDAAEGSSPMSWDVHEAIDHELSATLVQLSALHNFTIESQVQLYAPLEFDPVKLENEGYGLTPDQLSVFVNSAEWTLSSSASNDPVLHFVIYVPSVKHRPMRLLNTEGQLRKSTTFTIPQWGAIFVYNPPTSPPSHLTPTDLHTPFVTFRNQLLSLLGVPTLPLGIDFPNPPFGGLSPWQLDAVLRRRAFENAKGTSEALSSIVNLVSQIEGMPVGPDVLGDIDGALDALEKTYTATTFPQVALSNSADAIACASRAFFNPGMLALLYFPPEHNLAVYTPLLAPIAVPLIVSVLREIRDWRKSRKATLPTGTVPKAKTA